MFRLILFNTWTFVNVNSTRTGHNSAGLSEPVLQYILYRFWQFSENDNMCKWKTWKVSSNKIGGHVVVAVWFPSKSPLHVLLLPVPVSLRSNVSVKSKLQHAPPGNPPGIWLFRKLLFKFPPTRDKMPFKCPTLGSIQVIKCPHPGDISRAQKWQKDDGNTFSCRTKSL